MSNDLIIDGDSLEFELDDSIKSDDTPTEPTESTFEVPEKFKGKSSEDIMKSYMELEKEFGRKANEVGELRKLTDDFLKREITKDGSTVSEPKSSQFNEDDFFDSPVESVRKVVQPEVQKLTNEVQQLRQERASDAFKSKHPDFMEIDADPEFHQWINESRYRQSMAGRVQQMKDYDAADELLNSWKERKSILETAKAKKEVKQERDKNLRAAASESSSTGESGQKVYRRADLIRLRIEDPQKYEAMADDIYRAYAEGRVR